MQELAIVQRIENQKREVQIAIRFEEEKVSRIEKHLKANAAIAETQLEIIRKITEEEKAFEESQKILLERKRRFSTVINSATSNSELRNAQQEVQSSQVQLDRLHQKAFELAMRGEAETSKLYELRKRLQKEEIELRGQIAIISKGIARMKEEIEKREIIRNTELIKLPEELIEEFQRLSSRYSGVVLAQASMSREFSDEPPMYYCGVCLMAYVPEVQNQVSLGNLQRCPHCSRILVSRKVYEETLVSSLLS